MNAAALLGTAACLATSATALAGPLSPPAGPIAPTHRTLTQVEPRTPIGPETTPGDADSLYRITQPGSYYLTGNVIGVSGKRGIEIGAAGVTLDLGGFTVQGVEGALGGIALTDAATDATIQHGTVRGWPQQGLIASQAHKGARLVGLTAVENGSWGLIVPPESIVDSCIVRANGAGGMVMHDGATVVRCMASGNETVGYQSYGAVTISESVAIDNAGWGMLVGAGSVVRGCTASRNDYYGIQVSNVNEATGGIVERCAASNNGAIGIIVGYGSLVSGCTAASNDDDGILVTSGGTVSGCTVYDNAGNGIQAQNDCAITDNQVRGHAGTGKAGIFAWASACRIEGNNVTSNTYGLRVTGTDNFIARNTARANGSGNFSIAAGNEMAPVITNPGSNTFSTMTPWSNVAY